MKLAAKIVLLLVGQALLYGNCAKRFDPTPPPPPEVVIGTPGNVDDIITTAQNLMGTPYAVAGKSPKGFDCSGFTNYVFKQHGINIPHSSKEQIKAGKPVSKCDAAKGDIIVFTGTNKSIREPGHVGIVLENKDCVIKFIHSSSASKSSGVKISSTGETNYQKRFLAVRRIIEN